MTNLEKLYRDKLILKAPAEYWDKISGEADAFADSIVHGIKSRATMTKPSDNKE